MRAIEITEYSRNTTSLFQPLSAASQKGDDSENVHSGIAPPPDIYSFYSVNTI